jgi:hypothetical protein
MPTSTSDENPALALPPPEELPAVEPPPGTADFLRLGAELRRTAVPIDGVHAAWVRLRVPVLADEPVRPTSLAALPLDIVNMLGVHDLDPRHATSINPDVTGHLSRTPREGWIALTGHTHYSPGNGHGVSMAVLSDRAGVFGTASTSQLLDPR